MSDELARLLARAYSVEQMRRPDINNPFMAPCQRPERRTRPSYRDPTGNAAVGNIDRERKKKKK